MVEEKKVFLKCPQCNAEARFNKVAIDSDIEAKEPALKDDFQVGFKGAVFLICKKCGKAMYDAKPKLATPEKKKIIVAR